MFVIFEPITFPITISEEFLSTAKIDDIISGKDGNTNNKIRDTKGQAYPFSSARKIVCSSDQNAKTNNKYDDPEYW